MTEQQFWQEIYALVILRGGDHLEATQTADKAADIWSRRWGDD